MCEFRIRGKCKSGVNTIISLAYIKHFSVFLLELQQNNLSNPDVYSEPCQTSKMECLVNSYNLLTILEKQSILDAWQSSEYASAICYTLLGKTEDPNKIDSMTM